MTITIKDDRKFLHSNVNCNILIVLISLVLNNCGCIRFILNISFDQIRILHLRHQSRDGQVRGF